MLTDTNPSEEETEESPSVNFGDLRELLGCEYVVNVVGRPDGTAVAGAGSHRYAYSSLLFWWLFFFLHVIINITFSMSLHFSSWEMLAKTLFISSKPDRF